MKLDKSLVRRFEQTQKTQGTAVAIYNVYWKIAAAIFGAAGVKKISTRLKA